MATWDMNSKISSLALKKNFQFTFLEFQDPVLKVMKTSGTTNLASMKSALKSAHVSMRKKKPVLLNKITPSFVSKLPHCATFARRGCKNISKRHSGPTKSPTEARLLVGLLFYANHNFPTYFFNTHHLNFCLPLYVEEPTLKAILIYTLSPITNQSKVVMSSGRFILLMTMSR